MTSASDLLVAAADRIRDLAAQATPAQWSVRDMAEDGHHGVWWVESEHRGGDGTTWATVAELETCNPRNDARWIAALSPAVAPHLERWLRETAISAERHVPVWRDSLIWSGSSDDSDSRPRTDAEVAALVEHHYGAALAFARSVVPELAGETP